MSEFTDTIKDLQLMCKTNRAEGKCGVECELPCLGEKHFRNAIVMQPDICEEKLKEWKAKHAEKLKPCPFCGGEVTIKSMLYVDESQIEYSEIVCGKCMVTMLCHYNESEAELRARWNKRAEKED